MRTLLFVGIRRAIASVAMVGLALGVLAGTACGPKEPRPVENPTPSLDPPPTTEPVSGPVFGDFSNRLKVYLEVRAKAEASVPQLKETSDPAKISYREKALADALRVARANAAQGEVFSPAAEKEFRRIVEDDFKSRAPAAQAAVLTEVPMKVPPRINTDYPTTLPLATVPPALLLNLPSLPEVLEYRFLGRHLILRDSKANLIVDYIPDAVPVTTATAAAGAH